MATPVGQFRPGRLIAIFVLIAAVLYALVFFTPGSKTPKLGIDLQGGTRITLTAVTSNGASPSQDSMNQARQIMEARVNGSGVAGAQVQIDGSNQLVVTVPGNQDLSGLTRTANLNIRELISQGADSAQLVNLVPSATGTATGTSTSAPSTAPAIGDTVTPGASAGNSTTGASSTAKATGSSTVKSTAATTGSAATTTVSSSAASQGLRRVAPATTAASTATTAAATPKTTAAATAPTTATAAASSAVGTALTGSTAATTAAATWPIAGSDPKNPSQPAGTDTTAWTTWETAVQTALTNGTITCAELEKTRGQDDPAKPLIACGAEAIPTDLSLVCSDYSTACVYLLDKTLIKGDEIDTAGASINTNGGGWLINVSFKTDGFKTWSSYTANNVGKQTAFTLDGQVLSAPSIQEAITTPVTQVTGNFTQSQASSLANSLKFGALPLFFSQAEGQTISAELGSEYLTAGLIAGGIGLLLVILYCLIYYRLLGLITILSLVLSGLLVYGIMVLLGRWISLSLDMAGIAGLIVAIGITADSFVIYFERLKDEVREGRSFRSAVPRGWERAKRTILSADAVSFLSALVLYLVAIGDVRGFAFTLGLSTVLDLVVVFLVTHPLVALAAGAKVFQSARFSGLGAVAAAGAQQRAAAARLSPKEA